MCVRVKVGVCALSLLCHQLSHYHVTNSHTIMSPTVTLSCHQLSHYHGTNSHYHVTNSDNFMSPIVTLLSHQRDSFIKKLLTNLMWPEGPLECPQGDQEWRPSLSQIHLHSISLLKPLSPIFPRLRWTLPSKSTHTPPFLDRGRGRGFRKHSSLKCFNFLKKF